MHIDKDLIQKRVSIEEACSANGIQIKRRNQILCPAHMERMGKPNTHYGNCLIYTGSNSFKCHSCGAGGDIFSLTMSARKCGFVEAIKFLAENCCPEAIEDDTPKAKPARRRRTKCPLSTEELELLGLKTSKAVFPIAMSYDMYSAKHPKEGEPGFGQYLIPKATENEEVLLCKTDSLSPEDLFRDDQECFWTIVFGKAQYTLSFCKKMKKAGDAFLDRYGLSRDAWNEWLDMKRNAAYHAKNLCRWHGLK